MKVKLSGREFQGMDGAYTALFTPFTPENRVNVEMLERMVEYHLAQGLRGFYLTGSTGEGFLLNEAERKQVVETVVKANRGRGKVIVHVGCLATDDAVTLARHAATCGADWVSSVGPVYFGQSFEGACRHYARIAEATDLPFMVYSIGQALVPERDVRFFDIKNIKGIKYTGRDYYSAQILKQSVGKEVIFFAGCDEQLLCGLALGNVFSGGIGTTYNIIPAHFARICALAEQGRFDDAAPVQDEANRVVSLMIESENWSYRKAFMKYIGLDCGPYRYPYAPLSDAEYAAFARRIAAQGIVKAKAAVAGAR
jgi:N-acetylneuraminate lyase